MMNISDEAGKNSNAVQAKKLPSSILRKKNAFWNATVNY